MTYEEIAKEMGISVSRAHQIFNEAMAKLRRQLTPEELEEFLRDLQEPRTMQDALEENIIYNTEQEDELRGFWKEENNEAITTFEGFKSK